MDDDDIEGDDDGPTSTSPTGSVKDGETREFAGSGSNDYAVKRVGEVYSCTCPGCGAITTVPFED
jgi:hypothetical protein